jgi:hypothetical protein
MTSVFSPVPPIRQEAKRLASGPDTLRGARIGVLDNSKANAGALLRGIVAELVRTDTALAGVVARKPSASIPASLTALDRLRDGCDVVLVGSADCGSCTSGAVQDAVALEAAGMPCVLVGTDAFESLIGTLSAWQGLERLRVALTPHPLGGIDESALAAKAEALAPAVRTLLIEPLPAR